jgi:hypothetical protein
METTPEPAAPSTEELADLEAEFARLESELASLDEADDDAGNAGAGPPAATEGAGA